MPQAAGAAARGRPDGVAGAAKRQQGQYYTRGDPFGHVAFRSWAMRAGLPAKVVLEPFAGANGLVRRLEEMGLCERFAAYDVAPAAEDVQKQDTLASFPAGHEVCVTNPPWLARNSARLRGLAFPATAHDDLYKHALEKCLANCGFVAALVPESFIRSGLFLDRLTNFISHTSRLFRDTAHPVGLALFEPGASADAVVWSQDRRIGDLARLQALSPSPVSGGCRVSFNEPGGNVGLLALDNTRGASIRFCDVRELDGYEVRHTSRGKSKLQVDTEVRIDLWNSRLDDFRRATCDVLMTSYRGLRADGMYRRRLDWRQARGIIQRASLGGDGVGGGACPRRQARLL